MEVTLLGMRSNRFVSALISRDGVIVLFPRLITEVEQWAIRTLRGPVCYHVYTLLIRGNVKHRCLRHQHFKTSGLFQSVIYSIQTEIKLYEAHSIVIVKNLQDIHNNNFLSSGLFKVVHQGWWTLQLINYVKAFRLQKVPKTVQHHGKFGKRLSFTFGESCQSGLKSLKAALPMILEKIQLDLGISGLDSGYIFWHIGKIMPVEGMQWI